MTLADVFELMGEEADRLTGIDVIDDLEVLGRASLGRILDIATQTLLEGYAGDMERATLRLLVRAKQHLEELYASADERPPLPRLRRQTFHVRDEVMVFLGDTPGSAISGWWQATVTGVTKGSRPEWRLASSDRGFFWRVEVTGDVPWRDSANTLATTTSEPRVQRVRDLEWFAKHPEETRLREIFAKNAERDWSPMWWLDAGLKPEHLETMQMGAWLERAIALIEQSQRLAVGAR